MCSPGCGSGTTSSATPAASSVANGRPPDEVSQRAVLALIARLVGQANVLTIPRLFIDLTGSHEAALLLSQILYWSERTTDRDGWFYKSAVDWEAELALSEYQVRKARKVLAPLGVETALRTVNNVPILHYRVDGPQFYKSILQFLQNAPATPLQKHPVVSSASTYTETTDIDHPQRELAPVLEGDATRDEKAEALARNCIAQVARRLGREPQVEAQLLNRWRASGQPPLDWNADLLRAAAGARVLADVLARLAD
jgi:hypothetical protein